MSAAARSRPGFGVLTGQLLHAFQTDLFAELAARGHDRLRPRHGIVMANLDPDGTRASDLAVRSGRHKQLIGRTVDELVDLGYVTREPDPTDGRAKLVVPTALGRDQITTARTISRAIERRYERALGVERYAQFRTLLADVVTAARRET